MLKKLPVALLATICSLHLHAQPKKALQKADYIVRHVNVLTMKDSTILPDQCVCIDDNKITYIGSDELTGSIETKANIINGNGKYMMPGLAEMHVHMPKEQEMKSYLTMHLMAGVTTIRAMRSKPYLPAYKHEKSFPVPNLHLSAPIITRATVLNEQTTDSLLAAYKNQGFDFIKVIDIKDTTSFLTLMKKAAKHKMAVCGHYLPNIGLETLIKNNYSSLEHLDGYPQALKQDEAFYKNMLQLTLTNNIYICPTLDWYRVIYRQLPESSLQQRLGLNYVHDTIKHNWVEEYTNGLANLSDSAKNAFISNYAIKHKTKLQILKQMADNNANLLIGSEGGDTWMAPGFNMIEEMQAFKEAGISNYKILQYATTYAARYLHEQDKWGTVEKGKDANVILLSVNPLQQLSAFATTEGVFLKGKYYSQKELTAFLN